MSATPFQALIMAGGKGTRLLPYTTVLPKPLMPLGDASVLEHLLCLLRRHKVRRVCLAVNHLRHLIQALFGDGHALGMEITYAVEDEPLGTCGLLAQVIDEMEERFLLLNGDLVTDMDMEALIAHHAESGAAASVAALRYGAQLEYGVLDVTDQGQITRIREKPRTEYLINMGVYALTRACVRPYLPLGRRLDMPELLQALVAAGHDVRAYEAECAWLDIGRPEDFVKAQALVQGLPEAATRP